MITLPQLLRDSARTYPDRRAVEDPERDNALTYGELETRSDNVREMLLRHGVRPGDRVGIYAPKSVGTVTAIFGILGARAAYVPVDAGAPPQRNAGIFEDCSIRLAIVAASLLDGLRDAWTGQSPDALEDLGDGLLLVRGVDQSGNEASTPEGEASPDEVAYILYTSGSTGKPKGVVHTHRSALSFIDWCSEAFQPVPDDRFSSHAPFHFDLSILDIYVPLKHGATLVLVGEDVGKQPVRLAPLIADRRITVWYSTPSILRLLAEYGRLDELDCSTLRFVLFAGEVFPVKHLRAIRKLWPQPRYFNLYGPTETNVCTYYEIPSEFPEERTEPFPIGFACSDDRTIVVDEDDREVEPGEEGELLVSGGSVMRDYWNLPERTAQAFFVDASGMAWYRTGDVVWQSPENGYIFVGRRDRMVKRRGYRVELGEIEAALYRHPLVTEAAVTSVPDEENGVLIRAFVTLSNGSRPSLVEMKRFCMEQLPAYMIPDRFVFPGPLPKTSTDKIDYQRLKELA
jgi:amino acid adenylation domain-containing protein